VIQPRGPHPLDTLRAGLDSDGSELAIAGPWWSARFGPVTVVNARASSRRPPGSPSIPMRRRRSCRRCRDTSKFSTKALARMECAGDTVARDHLPVVVDLKPPIARSNGRYFGCSPRIHMPSAVAEIGPTMSGH